MTEEKILGKRTYSLPLFLTSVNENIPKKVGGEARNDMSVKSDIGDDAIIDIDAEHKNSSDMEIDISAVEASLVYVNQFQQKLPTLSQETFPILQIQALGESVYLERSFFDIFANILFETQIIDQSYETSKESVGSSWKRGKRRQIQ